VRHDNALIEAGEIERSNNFSEEKNGQQFKCFQGSCAFHCVHAVSSNQNDVEMSH
jgi:hypothetical protein